MRVYWSIGVFMGKAMVVYKVYPEENVSVDTIEPKIKEIENVTEVKREPIAFGLELLKVAVVVDDKTGKPEEIENQIKNVEGVKRIETESLSLIS